MSFNAVLADSAPARNSSEGAKTVAGKLLAFTQDLVWKPADQASANQRAQRSDVLAEVALDTIAMLPGVQGSKAALVRAALLSQVGSANETPDKIKFAQSFAFEFVEGLALNKLSRMAQPGGLLNESLQARISSPIAREATGHLAFGGGLGAIKAGMDQHTWVDEHGQFSALNGLHRTGTAMLAGSLLNLPAGFIGTRIAKTTMDATSARALDPRMGTVLAGSTSGYTAGSVLGGLESLRAGADWNSFVNGMHEGGIAGAAGGALGLSLLSMRKVGFHNFENSSKNERMPPEHASETLRVSGKAKEISLQDRGQTANPPRLDDATYGKLEYPKALHSESTLLDRVKQLGGYELQQRLHEYPIKGAEKVSFTSLEDYNRKIFRQKEEPFRIYKARGVEISIPDGYARSLDQVLSLRMKAASETAGKAPEQVQAIMEARQELDKHPLKDRAHPVDILPTLELPDRGLVKHVVISPAPFPYDAWLTHTDKWIKTNRSSFNAIATADGGTIRWYAADRHQPLEALGRHEWGHLLKDSSHLESKLFDMAAFMERDGFYLTQYSRRNNHENYAEHIMGLLDARPEAFWQTAHEAPLRTVVLGRGLAMALGNNKSSGPLHATFSQRLHYIQEKVLPQAQAQLVEMIAGSDARQAARATTMLGVIADQNHIAFLTETARTHESRLVRWRAFNAVVDRVEHAHMHRQQYRMVKGADATQAILQSALELGIGNSGSKGFVLGTIETMAGKDIKPLQEIVKFNPRQQTTAELAASIAKLDDSALQRSAWSRGLELFEQPGDRVQLALEVIDRSPDLGDLALIALKAHPEELPDATAVLSKRQEAYVDIAALDTRFGAQARERAVALMKDPFVYEPAFRKLAFQEALQRTGDDSAARIALAKTAMHKAPGLLREATEVLASEATPETKNMLVLLEHSPDATVRKIAVEGLRRAAQKERFIEFKSVMQSGTPEELARAAQRLTPEDKLRAIPMLLNAFAYGLPETRTEAYLALSRGFAPALFKFEARQMIQRDPSLAPRLKSLMDNRVLPSRSSTERSGPFTSRTSSTLTAS